MLLIIGCEREPVEDYESEAVTNSSAFQDNVVKLDTLVFTNPLRTNNLIKFDLIGEPPAIKAGDIVYYPGIDGMFGKVITATRIGSRMVFNVESCQLDKVFKSVSFLDTVNSGTLYSRTRTELSEWNSDTLKLSGFDLFNNFWNSKPLQVQFTSGKIYSKSTIGELLLVGQGTDPWFDRCRLDFNYSLEIDGELTIKTSIPTDAQDSLLIEKSMFGPFIINGFPITYQVETWMGFHAVTTGDTLLSLSFSGVSTGNLALSYNYWGKWSLNQDNNIQNAEVRLFNGPRLSDYSGSIYISQIVTPYFCGEPAVSLINHFAVNMSYDLSVPAWQSIQTCNTVGSAFRSGQTWQGYIPDLLTTGETKLYEESQNGLLDNQPPKASFTVDPPAGFTDTNFKFDASATTDLEGPVASLMMRWDFDGDNHFDTEYSTERIIYNKFSAPGEYLVVLEVMDPEGLKSRTTKTVVVNLSSSAPVAFFTVTPESGRISDAFVFDASGCYDIEDGITKLKVRWDFDGDGIWDLNWTNNKAAVFVYAVPGTYIARLEVIDTQGLIGSTTRIIVVAAANIKPTAVFTVAPDKGTIETLFNFDASGCTDPEDSQESLRVRWDWENDGIYDTEYRTLKTIQHRFTVAGQYTVVMEVIDTEGYGSTFTKEIVVSNPNTPPEAEFSINPEPGSITTEFTFDASLCSDTEDSMDQLEVRWDWDNDNRYDTEYTTDKVIKRIFSVAGTYIIKVQVRDSGGLTAIKAHLLIIQ
ncbi:MAG: PKD domain-containing protein [Bacteroidales bacterium]|nr:PKD domain-containing protein [Bacteroidales bacterium]